jgi:CHRD domain
MKRLGMLFVAVSAGLATLAFALPAGADGGRPFVAEMTGAQEVPPADPDGSGTAAFTVNPGVGEVCFTVTSENITLPVVAAHIHPGEAGVVGPPLVFLLAAGATDADGNFSGCTAVDRATAKDILKRPWAYYVNLHTTDYPGGAIRAQLA